MITQKELEKLNKIESKKNYLISLYLNTDQRFKKPEEIKISLKNLLKKSEEFLDKASQNKIKNKVKLELKKETKSLVFFICPKEKIWYQYSFLRPLPSGIFIERNLHLAPLIKMLDEYERYCVAVVDKEKAKIFSVYLGQIEELKNIFTRFPGKHKQGGWAQARFQRHIRDHLNRHLKKVNSILFDFFRKEDFDRIILAGSKEVLPLLKKNLHPFLKKKLAGQFYTELFAPLEKFLKQSLLIEEKIERQKEKEKVVSWQKFLGKKTKAVSGLEKVIEAVFQKRVLELFIDLRLRKKGYWCSSCHFLSLKRYFQCPNCGWLMEKVDLIDELVQEALRQNAKVEFVKDDKELKELGGIGAMLRY